MGVALHRCQWPPGGGLICGLSQHSVQPPRDLKLAFAQIGIAGRQGQAVVVPHGRRADDFGGNIQIADQPPHDHQLLPVLLAENRHIRLDLVQQLGDHQGHAAEHLRPECAFQSIGRPPDVDRGGRSRRIHFLHCRREQEVTTCPGQKFRVPSLLPRIGSKVLMGGELGRVDEDTGDDPVRALSGLPNQRQMPCVQGTHGRHKADGESLPSPGAQGFTQCRDAADHRKDASLGHGERINPLA